MDLNTNMEMIGKRTPFLARYRVGVTKEGKLNGVEIQYYCDDGCSPNEDPLPYCLEIMDNGKWIYAYMLIFFKCYKFDIFGF